MFGGYNGTESLNIVEKYDPRANRWFVLDGKELPLHQQCFGVALSRYRHLESVNK